MYNLFIFFLPSVLGIKVLKKLNKNDNIKELFLYYLLLVLFSNFICSGIIVLLNNFDGNLVLYAQEHLKFSIKYLILSISINLLLSFIYSILIKNLNVILEVKYENKKDI